MTSTPHGSRSGWRRFAWLLLAPIALLGAFAGGASEEALAPSDHYDGERFFNAVPLPTKRFGDFLRWRWSRTPPRWQAQTQAQARTPSYERPPARVGSGELRVTFVGHATLLVQRDGINLLTDPIYAERAGFLDWLGPERYVPPGVPFEELPPIDAVVISHNHYDHLDLPTLVRLEAAFHPHFIVGLGNGALLRGEGIEHVTELDWWQSVEIGDGVRVTSTPAQHWSRRGLFDTNRTLWCAYVIEGEGGPVYFAGDTGWGPHFEATYERFGPMRLALLPIGAYKPRWFMRPQHISPEEAVDAALVLRAAHTVPMHFGTFALGDDGQSEPLGDLHAYLELLGDGAPPVDVLGFGEGRQIDALPASSDDVAGLSPQDASARARREATRRDTDRSADPAVPTPPPPTVP